MIDQVLQPKNFKHARWLHLLYIHKTSFNPLSLLLRAKSFTKCTVLKSSNLRERNYLEAASMGGEHGQTLLYVDPDCNPIAFGILNKTTTSLGVKIERVRPKYNITHCGPVLLDASTKLFCLDGQDPGILSSWVENRPIAREFLLATESRDVLMYLNKVEATWKSWKTFEKSEILLLQIAARYAAKMRTTMQLHSGRLQQQALCCPLPREQLGV